MKTTAYVWPRDVAGFEQLPFIHSVLRGARDGVDGVGILTDCAWLPEDIDGADAWGDNWIEARSQWIKYVAPLLLNAKRS